MHPLRSISLINYKRFEKFTLTCKGSNVLVGPNNAGKSSTLDALRIISDFMRYAGYRLPYRESHGNDGVCATYRLDQTLVSIPLTNVVKDYSDEPARIHVKHTNGNSFKIELHPSRPAIGYLVVSSGKLPSSLKEFRAAFPLDLVIVPTLAPFEENEPKIEESRVKSVMKSRLASRNFRNIWLLASDKDFEKFRILVSKGWEKIDVHRPEAFLIDRTYFLEMMFREGASTREVHWAGFGFQVWMQICGQMVLGTPSSVLVLDEPDVYLHPDLQKRLVDIVKSQFSQNFLATHSTEIINHVRPGDVVMIDNKTVHAKRVSSDRNYKQLYSYIGSSENADFAKLSRAKRIIFFEGNDKRLIKKLPASSVRQPYSMIQTPST